MKRSTKEVTVGKFTVNINTTCLIKINERPTYNPVEYDCIKGAYDGELLAKSIATLTKAAPVDPISVEQHLAECELTANLKVSFNIYHECQTEEFIQAY